MMGRPEIEIDEQWSYVGNRQQQVWTWTAVERGSCRVIGFAVGERSEQACRELWQSLPANYRKRGVFYTDVYDFPSSCPQLCPVIVDSYLGALSEIS
jgi:IS1 family transposase